MNRRLVVAGTLAAAVLGVTGVGVAVAESGSGAPSPASYGSPPSGAVTSAVAVMTARTVLGQTLVDGSGRTLYLFEADTATTSTCYGVCTSAWPPATAGAVP